MTFDICCAECGTVVAYFNGAKILDYGKLECSYCGKPFCEECGVDKNGFCKDCREEDE